MTDFVKMQLENQVETYGGDPRDLQGAERMSYLRDMTLALEEELHEIMRCYDWKPWRSHKPTHGLKDSAVSQTDLEDEFGDVIAFLGNIARVCGLTTDDIMAGFVRKLARNRARDLVPVES